MVPLNHYLKKIVLPLKESGQLKIKSFHFYKLILLKYGKKIFKVAQNFCLYIKKTSFVSVHTLMLNSALVSISPIQIFKISHLSSLYSVHICACV